ncbi:hypothetical protein QP168_09345 [Aerococcus urinae]|uniref:Uncharacterized protein n=1 Tax=Aerococcus mictus TaxID=2976810 RepID=A0A1E9PHR0_9LACT|nr:MULTISPECIES: hypothetical protein [Aerococcus]KAA9291217.1 hypothetical protein F6I06_06105 [Aerococcus mictus]MBU5611219.1 hypothetical protein [Aerococcus urinae]MCY3064954.1 hypothetical protein [Aerococcus mictus]MCY3077323.1 hypothetical protein [Aerococcus mictus]MCY3081422.1 hypothetical protein [Aerococcus mictus]
MNKAEAIRILKKELYKIDFSGLSEENLEKVQRYVDLYTVIQWLKRESFRAIPNSIDVQEAWNNIAKGWETIFDENEESENN